MSSNGRELVAARSRPTSVMVGLTDEGKLNFEFAKILMRNRNGDSARNKRTLSRSHYCDTCVRCLTALPARVRRTNQWLEIFVIAVKIFSRLLAFLFAFAAELLELGEHCADVELAGLLLGLGGGGDFGLLAGSGLGGRQQGRAGIDRRRLFLVGALHFEVEVDLR